MLIIRTLTVGPLGTNCYLVWTHGKGECAAVDPGGDAEAILSILDSEKLQLSAILLTHCHADHLAAAGELKRAFPEAAFCVPEAEVEWLSRPTLNLSYFLGAAVKAPPPDRTVAEGDRIEAGGAVFEAMLCPGHSPGSIAYLVRQDGGAPALFDGDILFAGGIGRSDLPGGDGDLLIETIRRRLLVLDPSTRVLPGHGPETTIGDEKASNPFLA